MASREEIELVIRSMADKAIADVNRLNKGLKKTDSQTKATEKSGKKLQKTQQGLNANFLKSVLTLTAVVGVLKKTVTAASDLEETTSKFNTVFGKQRKVAEQTASVLVESYAMSTREAKQYLASVQDLLVPMGMFEAQAAQMSGEVVKLAADLGSFNNLPTERVMMDMQSALVGNFETMKKYGVILNETVVQQEAMNSGLWNGKGRIDAVAKSQAAWNIILRSTKAAQGDMIRTGDSFANVLKKLFAVVEDIAADFGKELLPALKNLGNVFIDSTSSGSLFRSVLSLIGKILSVLINLVAHFANGLLLLANEIKQFVNNIKEGAAQMQLFFFRLKHGMKTVEELRHQLGSATQRGREFNEIMGTLNNTYHKSNKLADENLKITRRMNLINKQITNTILGRTEEEIQAQKKSLDATKMFTEQKGEIEAAGAKKSAETRIAAAQKYISYVQSSRQLELDLEEEKYAGQMARAMEYNFGIEEIELAHKEKMAAINEKHVKMQERRQAAFNKNFIAGLGINASAYQSYSSFMLNNLDKTSKTQFKVWKAFAIQQAIMDTYRAANASYAALAGIPIIGPALGAAAAASAIAVGIMRVGQISKTKFQGAEQGALIRGSAGGTTLVAGERNKDELIVPFENEEVMDRVRASFGGGGGTVHIENFYALGDAQEMAMEIDRQLWKLRQDSNSTFATAIEGD